MQLIVLEAQGQGTSFCLTGDGLRVDSITMARMHVRRRDHRATVEGRGQSWFLLLLFFVRTKSEYQENFLNLF
jgi:hypothetical protein